MLLSTALTLSLIPVSAEAAEVHVLDVASLTSAIDAAAPGDEIILVAGTYVLSQPLYPDIAGLQKEPIVLRAEAEGAVTLQTNAVMAFEVSAPWWSFEDLDIQGVCSDHSDCEHAFHIISLADHTTGYRGSGQLSGAGLAAWGTTS